MNIIESDIINIYGRKPTNKGSKDSNATLLSDEVLRDTSRDLCLGKVITCKGGLRFKR